MNWKLTSAAGFVAMGVLGACTSGNGTNPINDGILSNDDSTNTSGDDGTGVDTGGSGTGGSGTTDPSEPEANTTNSKYGGEVNNVTVNEAAGTMTVNNLPYDGQNYTRKDSVTVLSGFDLYENKQVGDVGTDKYFAVYRESDSGALQVFAIGTGDYQDEGYGGYAVKRDSANINMPSQGEAVYNGQYAGVRVIYSSNRGQDDVQLTSGDVKMRVDFGDFDVVGAVDGTVQNRSYYDTDGNMLGVLPTIYMSQTSLSGDGSFSGSAYTTDTDNLVIDEGNYEGLLAGIDSSEIGGVIILDGPFDDTAPGLSAYERGVFTAAD